MSRLMKLAAILVHGSALGLGYVALLALASLAVTGVGGYDPGAGVATAITADAVPRPAYDDMAATARAARAEIADLAHKLADRDAALASALAQRDAFRQQYTSLIARATRARAAALEAAAALEPLADLPESVALQAPAAADDDR